MLQKSSEFGPKKRFQKFKGFRNEKGAVGWIFLWLIGIPIPILLVLFALRGCT